MVSPARRKAITQSKAKSTSNSREGRAHRIKLSELPADVKALVTAAQNCVRMRIALKSAWTKEPAVKSTRLPTSDSMIETSLREAYRKRTKTGKGDASLKAAYLSLQDQKGHDNEERAEMRKKVYTVVSARRFQYANK